MLIAVLVAVNPKIDPAQAHTSRPRLITVAYFPAFFSPVQPGRGLERRGEERQPAQREDPQPADGHLGARRDRGGLHSDAESHPRRKSRAVIKRFNFRSSARGARLRRKWDTRMKARERSIRLQNCEGTRDAVPRYIWDGRPDAFLDCCLGN